MDIEMDSCNEFCSVWCMRNSSHKKQTFLDLVSFLKLACHLRFTKTQCRTKGFLLGLSVQWPTSGPCVAIYSTQTRILSVRTIWACRRLSRHSKSDVMWLRGWGHSFIVMWHFQWRSDQNKPECWCGRSDITQQLNCTWQQCIEVFGVRIRGFIDSYCDKHEHSLHLSHAKWRENTLIK